MNFKIPKEQLISEYEFPNVDYPKYTSQLINWANQNAQATRPRYVGQMSDLFPQFRNEAEDKSIHGWEEWYSERFPNSVEEATDKVYEMILNLREAMQLIDRDLVKKWVEDLIINKTYLGLYYQKVVLQGIAERTQIDDNGRMIIQERQFRYNGETVGIPQWRLATPTEEAQGIDGFVGDKPYSIKSESYRTMTRLPEHIDVSMVYYKTNSKGDLIITVEE